MTSSRYSSIWIYEGDQMGNIKIAASQRAFIQLFNTARDNFRFAKEDSVTKGPITVKYKVAFHFQDGNLILNDDNTIEIKQMEIVWDTLVLDICFDLPPLFGGYCVVPIIMPYPPFYKCAVYLPPVGGGQICTGSMDLSHLISSKVRDVKATLTAMYYVDPARTPNETDLQAEFNNHPNMWKVFIHPILVHVDPIDVDESVGNILEQAVKDAIENEYMQGVDDWGKKIIWKILGNVIDIVKKILSIDEDINDWISDLLDNTLGFIWLIEQYIADYFAKKHPICTFEDPSEIIYGNNIPKSVIPVKIPLKNLNVQINSKEMIINAYVGEII